MDSAIVTSTKLETPTRRISWKGDYDYDIIADESRDEKHANVLTSIEIPVQDIAEPNHHATNDSKRSLSAGCDGDIESQYNDEFGHRTPWKQKIIIYSVVFLSLVLWLLLIMSVLVLTDTLFPTALRSYHKLKELGIELANTKFELAEVKSQISMLYQSVKHMTSIQKVEE